MKENYNYYSKSSIITDVGIFSPNFDYVNFYLYDYSNLDFSPILTDNIVFQSTIYVTNTTNIYNRTYISLTEIAAYVGGYMSVVYFIMLKVYTLYVDSSMQHFFYNKIFKFECNKEYENRNNSQFSFINTEKSILKVEEEKSSARGMIKEYKKANEKRSVGIISIKPELIEIKSINNLVSKKVKSLSNKHLNDARFSLDKNNINLENHESHESHNNHNLDPDKHKPDKASKYTNHSKAILSTNHIPSVIDLKKKKNIIVEFSHLDVWLYRYCYCVTKQLNNNELKIKNQLLYLAHDLMQKKIDILELVKFIDQFRLLKKIILNENQCYMLENRENQTIINKPVESEDIFTWKRQKKDESLIKYLKNKNDQNDFDHIDNLLYSYLEKEIKDKVTDNTEKVVMEK